MKGFFRAAGVVLTVVLAASVAGATEHTKDGSGANVVSKKRMSRASAPDGIAHPKGVRLSRPKAYGASNPTRISVLSYAFQGNNPFGDVILDDGDAYRYYQNSTDSRIFSASVSIPAGTQITEIGFDNCDNFATGTMTMHLVDRSGDHQELDVAVVSSTDGAPCGFDSFTLTTPYDHDDNIDHVFEIFIEQDLVDETLKFRSAYVQYEQRVSPAPAVPTFNDVPTNDFGFQYIEALVASGITGGTGGGNYSPNAPVTRRQMAIFIAKALGLHWPY